jgi:membrane protein
MNRLKQLWKIGWKTWERFSEVKGDEAAAAISYYALFSLFPALMLVIIPFATFLKDPEIYSQILGFAERFFPGSEEFLRQSMNQLVQVKGTSLWGWGGFMGLAILLWSGTGVFAGISQNINQAWHSTRPRHFLTERIIAIMMIVCLSFFLGVSLLFTTFLKLYLAWAQIHTKIELLIPIHNYTTSLLLWLVPLAFTFTIFLFMYRFIPNTRVFWREAGWGALFSTVVGEFSKAGFVWWYFRIGLANFRNLYGGMSTFVGFMLWTYLYSLIILLGANLSAAIASETRPEHLRE